MPTFIYAPGVKVYIETARHGILDVSDDLTEGQLIRRSDGVSTFNFSLQNARRKYDSIFTPNDRIIVMMKRLTWMRVLTGYLNSTPFFSVWPRVVPLSASCSMKRLQFFYWDSTLGPSKTLVYNALQNENSGQVDGGLKNATIALMETVVGWPKSKIHIAQIPLDWFGWVTEIAEGLAAEIDIADAYAAQQADAAGAGASVGGPSVLSQYGLATITGAPEGCGILPNSQGKISHFADGTDADNGFGLTGEKRRGSPPIQDEWYCAMRWQYVRPTGNRNPPITRYYLDGDGKYGPKVEAAMAWWKNRKILVYNPDTGKSVVLRAADWGPNTWADRVIDVSKTALDALGAKTDTVVRIAFARDHVPLGPVRAAPISDWASEPGVKNSTVTNIDSSQQTHGQSNAAAFLNVALTLVTNYPNIPYVFGGGHGPNDWKEEVPDGMDCSAFITWVYAHTVGAPYEINQSTAAGLAAWCNRNGGLRTDIEVGMRTKGALMFRGRQGINGIGHVEISCGDGIHTVGTRRTGTPASVVESHKWTHWGLARRIDYTNATSGGSIVPTATQDGGTGSPVYGSDSPPNSTAPIDRLFNNVFMPDLGTFEGSRLAGVRALMNDESILPYIKSLMNSALRSFSSAPNGDFIAWFPDYYGIWGTAAKMIVQPIEVRDFTVEWSDDAMVTHEFVSGDQVSSFETETGVVSTGMQNLAESTSGIATIDMKFIMKALFGIEPTGADETSFAADIYERFGARPNFEVVPGIFGPKSEFFMALYRFMQYWAKQWNADVPLTFMPELWPGMLLQIPAFNFQGYVTTVSHSFRFGPGGGFDTTVNIAAPGRISEQDGRLMGLPLGSLSKPGRGAGNTTFMNDVNFMDDRNVSIDNKKEVFR